MDTDIWLPLATLVGGWGLAQVTETLKDRRASNRERLARRVELQRSTLLSLQDALLELSTAADAARHTNALATISGPGEDDRRQAARQEKQRMWQAQATAYLLHSRVEDRETRIRTTLAIATATYDDATAKDARKRAVRSYNKAIDRIGELLRERY
jgi:hypothetical protein